MSKTRLLKLLLFCISSCLFTSNVQATHIVGGELYYRYLGNSNYEITLIVYRDCYFGVPPFDDPASIGIYDNPFYNLVQEVLVSTSDSVQLPPSITSTCFIPPVSICYVKATYRDTVTLPANGSGYWLVYQRCCRNNTILNIDHPEDRGATYTAFIPGTQSYSQNSNPVYTSLPPTFICQNIPFVFDHSATDPEGDSIVYEICEPLDYAGFQGNPMPQPPFPPPYSIVPWRPPYNLGNVLGGTPMEINSSTGQLTCTPSTVGQFVFGICAHEYRGGVYLSTTRRDYQVNVVPCSAIVVAAIQDPILSCDDNSVTFVNQSVNAGSYHWDFGDNSNPNDTSNEVQPVYLYPDTGTYTVQLIAYSPIDLECNDTITGTVYVYPGYDADASVATIPCSPDVQFTDVALSSAYYTAGWYWDFGDGDTSTAHNPSHTYPGAGNYTTQFISTSDRGCSDTIIIDVNLNYATVNIAAIDPVRCYGECNGQALAGLLYGIPPFSIQWNDSLNQQTQTAVDLCAGDYEVIVTDSAGCIDSVEVTIPQPDLLNVTAVSLSDYCRQACIGYAISNTTGGNSGYQYQWNDPATQNTPVASGLCSGNFNLWVTDSRGCQDSVSVNVPYADSLPYVEATANPPVIYEGQITQLNATVAPGYIYNWTYDPTLNSTSISNPIGNPVVDVDYYITVIDSNGCTVYDTVSVRVINVTCKEPEVFVPNAFTPNDDHENDVLFVRGNTVETMYFAVYDRWGEKIFETEDKSTGWDGFYNGEKVSPGVFVYYLKAVCYDKSELISKGNVTVIR